MGSIPPGPRGSGHRRPCSLGIADWGAVRHTLRQCLPHHIPNALVNTELPDIVPTMDIVEGSNLEHGWYVPLKIKHTVACVGQGFFFDKGRGGGIPHNISTYKIQSGCLGVHPTDSIAGFPQSDLCLVIAKPPCTQGTGIRY